MKTTAILSIAIGITVILASLCGAQDDERQVSLGPLVRFDPNAPKLKDLIAVHGDPSLGLPASDAGRALRIGSSDMWFVGLTKLGVPSEVAVMELDRKTGECRTRQVLSVAEVLGVSPDGKSLFGVREDAQSDRVWECLVLADNRALWSVEKGVRVEDAIYSPDGRQVIVFHALGKGQDELPVWVSWYDAVTGVRLRRVALPGLSDISLGNSDGNLLAVSEGTLFVAVPAGTDGKFFMIAEGAAEALPVEIEGVESSTPPQVRVGGKQRELLAFYDANNIRIRRFEKGRLIDLGGLTTPTPRDDGAVYPNNVRFSPDGQTLVVGRHGRTLVMPITRAGIGKEGVIPEGTPSGDFTSDGKFFVRFDRGGGRSWDVASWATVEGLQKREHPIHCCPITEAEYSFSGDYIVSTDINKLLLWSKDGRLLAQLVTDREDKGLGIRMQSAIIVEKTRTVYAADGWNFLEWSLDEVEQRLGRKPLNVPRINGKVVFSPRSREDGNAELMDISMDASGQNLLTATRHEVRLHPVRSTGDFKILPVPQQNIHMSPRTFTITGSPIRVFLHSSQLLYELDPDGSEEPSLLNKFVAGFDVATGRVFTVKPYPGREADIYSTPLGQDLSNGPPSSGDAKLPKEWNQYPFDHRIVLGSNGAMIVFRAVLQSGPGCVLAVMDWSKKEIVWSQELAWEPRSAALSADGKRLVIGSSNKAIYVFDFERMTGGG